MEFRSDVGERGTPQVSRHDLISQNHTQGSPTAVEDAHVVCPAQRHEREYVSACCGVKKGAAKSGNNLKQDRAGNGSAASASHAEWLGSVGRYSVALFFFRAGFFAPHSSLTSTMFLRCTGTPHTSEERLRLQTGVGRSNDTRLLRTAPREGEARPLQNLLCPCWRTA